MEDINGTNHTSVDETIECEMRTTLNGIDRGLDIVEEKIMVLEDMPVVAI
jgi:hypothetical protein